MGICKVTSRLTKVVNKCSGLKRNVRSDNKSLTKCDSNTYANVNPGVEYKDVQHEK